MIPATTWEPAPSDIAWQKQWINILTDKATWAVPGSQSVFEIDKVSKTFMLRVGDPEDETNRRIAKVFKRIGFSEVGPRKPENPLEKFRESDN